MKTQNPIQREDGWKFVDLLKFKITAVVMVAVAGALTGALCAKHQNEQMRAAAAAEVTATQQKAKHFEALPQAKPIEPPTPAPQ